MEQSRAWGTVGFRADQGRWFEQEGSGREGGRFRKPGEQVGAPLDRRTQGAEALARRKGRKGKPREVGKARGRGGREDTGKKNREK